MNNFGKFITLCLFSLVLVSQSDAAKKRYREGDERREDAHPATHFDEPGGTAAPAPEDYKRARSTKLEARDLPELVAKVADVRDTYFGVCHAEGDPYHIEALNGCDFLIFNIGIAAAPLRQAIFQ